MRAARRATKKKGVKITSMGKDKSRSFRDRDNLVPNEPRSFYERPHRLPLSVRAEGSAFILFHRGRPNPSFLMTAVREEL